MAEGDCIVTNIFKTYLLEGRIACESDDFKMALYSVALASPDGSPAYSATNEIVASGYTAGGQSAGTCVVSQDDTNNWGKWDDDGTDFVWTNLATATILEARLYDDTVTTPTADPVCLLFEIATNSNGGNYTLSVHANGLMTLG